MECRRSKSLLKKRICGFLSRSKADIYCLQETKLLEEQLTFHQEGYFEYLNPAERKGYSGTMIYTKKKPLSVTYGINIEKHDQEGRVITLEYKDFYLVTVYTPNAKRGLERLDYRMEWEDDFKNYLKELDQKKPVVVCGDLNVAHEEIDLKNPKANIGNAGFTYEERNKMTDLLNAGFIDTFRYFHPNEENHYTWWSYMGNARSKNIGWRIDYFLVSERIIDKVKDTMIYQDVYGSDHCPIGISLELD